MSISIRESFGIVSAVNHFGEKFMIKIQTLLTLFSMVFLGFGSDALSMPWHSNYEPKVYDLKGYKALIITTSYGTLDKLDSEGNIQEVGKETGVYAAELTEPYYEFLDSGITVDVASLSGGAIPIDPQSLKYLVRTKYDSRYLKDSNFKQKVENSLSIKTVSASDYDIIFISGGWGAAYDLAQSETLGEFVSQAFAEGKLLAAVCHGPLGFIQARTPEGRPLLEGRSVTAVTNKQVSELGIEHTPMHPETEMLRIGANYESRSAFRDIFAHHVVEDGRLITGQNQRAGVEVAQRAMAILSKD